MDSPVISRLFRQLFAHRACRNLRSHSSLPFRIRNAPRIQTRELADRRGPSVADADAERNESNWQQRSDLFSEDKKQAYNRYPMVTADQLRGRRERPKRVKMLTRDFIEGGFCRYRGTMSRC